MKTAFRNSPVWKGIIIAFVALVVLCVVSWYLWFSMFSAQQLRDAVERGDFRRAERIWNRGARALREDPYAQLMRIRDRLQAVDGVRVTEWKIGKLQPINGTNRYFALLDVQLPDAQVGIGLAWEGRRWSLKTEMPNLPSYVKASVDLNSGAKWSSHE